MWIDKNVCGRSRTEQKTYLNVACVTFCGVLGDFCGCGVAKLPPSNPVCVWQISGKACPKRCWVDLKQMYANSLANMQINS